MQAQLELQQDLVFVGGGHAHALVLRMLAMEPIRGLRATLVSPASHTPYSGMLPGLVAGHYSFEQTHIDLARLCRWAGVRFIEAEVTAMDPQAKTLSLAGRPPIDYDLVSLDIGSQPELESVQGARAHAVPVKPVAGLWQRWRALAARLENGPGGERLAVVGGGAGSVELALAMAHALAGRAVSIDLYCGAGEILQGYNRGARRAVMAALTRHGVRLLLAARVVEVDDAALVLASGERQLYDELFWCTGAAAAPWVAESGLACDSGGFLQLRDSLQALADDDVFGAGDIATQVNHPRPKAGVYAVRQGPVLAHNLRARLLGRPLRKHRPQQRFLSLVSLGDRRAAADRGPWYAAGSWVWRWKDRIDRQFMDRFAQLPPPAAMGGGDVIPGAGAGPGRIHCGGCGAKVGGRGLAAVLEELAREFPDYCLPPGQGDDAAALPGNGAGRTLQSLDVLREIVTDPWLMGRIAANHALSDLYACGARPVSALAAVTLPFARGSLLQRDLRQLLAGALHEFSHSDCLLAGGHSMQGPELQIGFAVTGRPMAAGGRVLGKRGARPGDRLILTKPLGTGVLFAGHMQQAADGRDIGAAIAAMLQSNAAAAQLALGHGASACTDVTGFGLLGHLLEMLAGKLNSALRAAALPALPGALDLLRRGYVSTGRDANKALGESALTSVGGPGEPLRELLFDPQTSGGLLIAVAANRAGELHTQLQRAGYAAALIGEIAAAEAGGRGGQVSLR